jgi:hypothetical protein
MAAIVVNVVSYVLSTLELTELGLEPGCVDAVERTFVTIEWVSAIFFTVEYLARLFVAVSTL